MKNPTVTLMAPITPSDTDKLPDSINGIYVGVSGDINMVARNDTEAVLFRNVPVGSLPVAPKMILATDTTAQNLVGYNLTLIQTILGDTMQTQFFSYDYDGAIVEEIPVAQFTIPQGHGAFIQYKMLGDEDLELYFEYTDNTGGREPIATVSYVSDTGTTFETLANSSLTVYFNSAVAATTAVLSAVIPNVTEDTLFELFLSNYSASVYDPRKVSLVVTLFENASFITTPE
jgi:hypothetical protein